MDSNIVEKAREKLAKYEERHESILEAAMKLFNERGYAGTTTASIAKEAGVVEKTIFNHYANKQTLFDACVEAILEELTQMCQQELEDENEDGTAFLWTLVKSYVKFARNNPNKFMFLVHLYSYRCVPAIDEKFKEYMENRLDEIESAIRAMQDKGVIKSQDHPRVLAGVFFSQYFNIIFLNEFMPKGVFNEDVAIKLVKRVMELRNSVPGISITKLRLSKGKGKLWLIKMRS